MKPYADTNFLCRLYLNVPGFEQSEELVEEAAEAGASAFPVTWLHRCETINAFEQHVFVGKHPGHRRVTLEQAAMARTSFLEDLAKGALLSNARLDLTGLSDQFSELSLRHTAKYGFRAYDILHVASALILKCDNFWSFDPKASKLAALEGLKTIR